MTLGMMMSVTYIVGQLSSPIEQLIDFSRSLQDAKISLERLAEIHQKEDEEQTVGTRLNALPDDRTLRLENLSFSYDGADRVTAIVGDSESGKSRVYLPRRGHERLGRE